MHPDAEAFEKAIFADPGDTLARGVYADWCEDQGNHKFAAWLRLPGAEAAAQWEYPARCQAPSLQERFAMLPAITEFFALAATRDAS